MSPFFKVILQGSDAMLIERAAGKRVDSKTGGTLRFMKTYRNDISKINLHLLIKEIYHTTFDWPTDSNVQQRLVVPSQNTEEDLVNRLILYNRHIGGILNY
jgi:adenylate kinase